MAILPTKKTVLVDEIMRGERKTTGGIILTNDDGKAAGVRNRWCRVYEVGTGVTDIKKGEWILVRHARWTRELNVDGLILFSVEYPDGVLCAWEGEGIPPDTCAEKHIAEGRISV